MTTWRDDIDLTCLEAFDDFEVAELASQCLQHTFQSCLTVLGLPEDFYDQVDEAFDEMRDGWGFGGDR